MAELLLTEAEKTASSYLEWSDEALGKLVRSIALNIQNERQAIQAATMTATLVSFVAENNAEQATFDMTGVTHADKPLGNWTIEVKKHV